MNAPSAQQRQNLEALLAIAVRLERGELGLEWSDEGIGFDCNTPRCLLGWYDHFHGQEFWWKGSEIMTDVMEHFGFTHAGQTKYLFGPNRRPDGDDVAELKKRIGIIRLLLSESSSDRSK